MKRFIFNHKKNKPACPIGRGNEVFFNDGIIPTIGESVNTNPPRRMKGLQFSKTVRYKGFSLIEMLMVISIILILLVVFQNLFRPKDTHLYNGQRCVNDLYSFINQFTMAGLSSKGFNSGGTMIYPISYKIEISTTNSKVTDSINTGGGYFQRGIANLSGDAGSNLCYINSIYNISLTGNNIEIEISKTSPNGQFNISGSLNNSTGHTDLILCKINSTGCMHIGQYIIDKRIQTITKRVCLGFSGNDCISWNQ